MGNVRVTDIFDDAFYIYSSYCALKKHFTSLPYNFVVADGHFKVSQAAFEKRADYKHFNAFAKLIDRDSVIGFLIAQFVDNHRFTISNAFEQPILAQKRYEEWQRRIRDLRWLYKTDLVKISERSGGSWRRAIEQVGTDYPLIFKMVSAKEISPETYSLMDDLFHQTSREYDSLGRDVMFLGMNLKYRKYRSFLSLTTDDITEITPRFLKEIQKPIDKI